MPFIHYMCEHMQTDKHKTFTEFAESPFYRHYTSIVPGLLLFTLSQSQNNVTHSSLCGFFMLYSPSWSSQWEKGLMLCTARTTTSSSLSVTFSYKRQHFLPQSLSQWSSSLQMILDIKLCSWLYWSEAKLSENISHDAKRKVMLLVLCCFFPPEQHKPYIYHFYVVFRVLCCQTTICLNDLKWNYPFILEKCTSLVHTHVHQCRPGPHAGGATAKYDDPLFFLWGYYPLHGFGKRMKTEIFWFKFDCVK